MTIKNEFKLKGLTKIDAGDEGAVFVRYDEPPKEERKREAELRETPMYYGGRDTLNFTLSVPIPRRFDRSVTALAIVTRSSKSRYTAICYHDRRIETFRADTLGGLQKCVDRFFTD